MNRGGGGGRDGGKGGVRVRDRAYCSIYKVDNNKLITMNTYSVSNLIRSLSTGGLFSPVSISEEEKNA